MLDALKRQVLDAAHCLQTRGVLSGHAGVTVIARKEGLVLSTPRRLSPGRFDVTKIVMATLQGRVVCGDSLPTKYLKSHTRLYREYDSIGAIVHSCSEVHAAQCELTRTIPRHRLSQTIEIGCTRRLSEREVAGDDNAQVAIAILDRIRGADLGTVPGLLVGGFGWFAWGKSLQEALKNVLLIETLAPRIGRVDLETGHAKFTKPSLC